MVKNIIIQHLILILLCLHFEPFPTLVDAGFAIRFRSATSGEYICALLAFRLAIMLCFSRHRTGMACIASNCEHS